MPLSESTVLQVLMRWRSRVSASAWVILRDTHEAEDIFQNVAVKSMTRDVQFETEAALLSWAFITSRREALDRLQRIGREASRLDPQILAILEADWQDRPAETPGDRIDALKQCLEQATSETRRLLNLRYVEGHPCQEVARQMGMGLNAIYKRLSRMHQSLRDCIELRLGDSEASRGIIS